MDRTDLEHIFGYHRPDAAMQARIESMREAFIGLAGLIVRETGSGPNQTIAIRKLHEASMATIFTMVAGPQFAYDVKYLTEERAAVAVGRVASICWCRHRNSDHDPRPPFPCGKDHCSCKSFEEIPNA